MAQTPLGSSISYQGGLVDSGSPANASYDFIFALHDAAAAGSMIAGPLSVNGVAVAEGLFTVELDFGAGAFDGNRRWLEIQVSPAGAGTFETLSPRQELTPAAYALHAAEAGSLAGFDPAGVWGLTGNAGTTPGTNFVGTTDDQPLEFHVRGARALRLEPAASGSLPNVIGGHPSNTINAAGSVIAGGGEGLGRANVINANGSFIGGGRDNTVDGVFAVVPGGELNNAGGLYSFAAGQQAVVRNAAQSGDGDGDEGSFVWSDATGAFTSTGPNQFLIDADGGVGINTNAPDNPLTVNGAADFTGYVGIGANVPANQLHLRGSGGAGEGILMDSTSGTDGLDLIWETGTDRHWIVDQINDPPDLRFSTNGVGGFATRVTVAEDGTVTATAFAGDGSMLTNLPSSGWSLSGNAGTTPGTDFIGTTDAQAFQIHVDNAGTGGRVWRVEPATDADTGAGDNTFSPNIIGGISTNSVAAGVAGAVIAGGGDFNFNGASRPNRIFDEYGVIGGGISNTAGNDDGNTASQGFATVSGGLSNTASGLRSAIGGGRINTASGTDSVIGGGVLNMVTDQRSTVGGGAQNVVSSNSATISGGFQNTASASSTAVGGGLQNSAGSASSTIAGGEFNTISGGQAAFIGGGRSNSTTGTNAVIGGGDFNTASGSRSTVGGGGDLDGNSVGNTAAGACSVVVGGCDTAARGDYSAILGGSNNAALGEGSVVLGGVDNVAEGPSALAAGERALALHKGSFVWASGLDKADFASEREGEFAVQALGGAMFATAAPGEGKRAGSGIRLEPGSGAWTALCDRDSKENFAPVDSREVLERVAAMPIATWNWKAQDEAIKHLGPTAQDFAAAFGLGTDDKGIATVDADGVALAAIQGLNAKLETENAKLRAEKDALEAKVASQEERLARLEALLLGDER